MPIRTHLGVYINTIHCGYLDKSMVRFVKTIDTCLVSRWLTQYLISNVILEFIAKKHSIKYQVKPIYAYRVVADLDSQSPEAWNNKNGWTHQVALDVSLKAGRGNTEKGMVIGWIGSWCNIKHNNGKQSQMMQIETRQNSSRHRQTKWVVGIIRLNRTKGENR